MFFEKNRNFFIGAGGVALLWIILFYTLIKPSWVEAEENRTSAEAKRTEWTNYTQNESAKKAAAKFENKPNDPQRVEYLARKEADRKLDDNRKKIDVKFADLKKIEFGNRETLKAFSLAAAGKGGDASNLVNEKVKQAILRANGILKVPLTSEKLTAEFGSAAESNNLLRVALFEAFLTACRDAKVEQIVQVRHFDPAPILVPEETKSEDEIAADEAKKKAKFRDNKSKDEEKTAEVDRLIQFPMKVQLRVTERYSNQVLFELEKPTPDAGKLGGDLRGYFCIRGFHIAVRENVPNLVEMTIQVSALLRESEVKAMSIRLKDPRGGSGGSKRLDDDLGI